MKKKKSKSNKYPKIYRFISDRKKIFGVYIKALKIFTLFIFIVVIAVLGLDLYKNIQEKQDLDFERKKIVKEVNFWQSFLEKNKGYRDGYLQLAILEYRLRDLNKARFYLNKSLEIDPNFEKSKELEKVLR